MTLVRQPARVAGPRTSRRAMNDKKPTPDHIFEKLKELQPCTQQEVIDALEDEWADRGIKMKWDNQSGFNILCREGRIATTGRTKPNPRSNVKAMTWRTTTAEERIFILSFLGGKDELPSGDTVLRGIAVEGSTLMNDLARLHPRTWRLIRRWHKGFLFKTVFKDIGIRSFMRRYDEHGKRRP